MLELEDVEGVACTVDDMEATDRSRSWFRRDGVREGVQGYKGRNDGASLSSAQAEQGCDPNAVSK